MKTVLGDWLKVLLVLFDDIVILAALFLILHYLGVHMPGYLSVILGVVTGIVVLIVHVRVIPSFHLRQVTGREGMTGQRGIVMQKLSPDGIVLINGENWQASTGGETIDAGEKIEVVGIEGLKLRVTPVEEKR